MIWLIEEKPRALYPHRRPTVSEFHALFIFFFLIISEPLFKCRYLIKRQIVHMETQCIHVQKKYCSDRVCAGNSIKTLGFNDCFTTSV